MFVSYCLCGTLVASLTVPGAAREWYRDSLIAATGRAGYDQNYYAELAHVQALLRSVERDGTDTIRCAMVRHAVGTALHHVHRYSEAEEATRASLVTMIAKLGPNHRNVGDIQESLALTLMELSQFREAEEHFASYWKIECARKAPEDFDLAHFLGSELGHLYCYAGRYDDAEKCFLCSIDLRRDRNGTQWESPPAYNALTGVYLAAGQLDKARKAVSASGKWIKRGNERAYRFTQSCEGRVLLAEGKPAEAAALFEKLLEAEKVIDKPHALHAAECQEGLGIARVKTGRQADGKALILSALAEYERQYGPNHPQIAATLETFCDLFPDDAGNKKARAKKIRAFVAENQPKGLDAAFPEIVK